MAGQGGALREIVAFFGLDYDKSQFKGLDQSINGMRDQIVGLARVFTTGLIANEFRKLITETAALGDQTLKASQRIGITTQALQELRFAGDLSGVAAETVDRSLQGLGRRAAEAARGTGEAKDTFRELGIRLRDANGRLRPTEELLGDVADQMSKTADAGDRMRIAMDVFGREGQVMVNMLAEGKTGLEAMRQEARELGLVMSDELIASSAEYDDTMDRLHGVIQGVKNMVTEELLPGIIDTTRALVAFVRENRELISGTIVEGARFFGTIFRSLAEVLWAAGRAIKDLAARMGPLGEGFLWVTAIVAGLTLLFGVQYAAVVVLIAILEDLWKFFKGENSVIGLISNALSDLFEQFAQGPIIGGGWADLLFFFRALAKLSVIVRDALGEIAGSLAFGKSSLARAAGSFVTGGVGPGLTDEEKKFATNTSEIGDAYARLWGDLKTITGIGASSASMPVRVPLTEIDPRSIEVNVNQTINPSPGMDEVAVGQAAAAAADESLRQSLRQTVAANAPRVSEKL